MSDDAAQVVVGPSSMNAVESYDRPQEMELVNWVEALRDEAFRARDDQAQQAKWKDWERGFWGEQWPDIVPSYKPPVVANEMQTLILSELSDLTDSPMKIYVQKDPAHGERDQMAEKAIQAYWKRNHVDLQVMLATLNGAIYPAGFVQCVWDTTMLRGQGEISTKSADPYGIAPDPDAVDEDSCRYWVLEQVMDLVGIPEKWPDHGWRVKADPRYSLKMGDATSQGLRGMSSAYRGPMYSAGQSLASDGWAKARVCVTSVFVEDTDLKHEIVDQGWDETTGEKKLGTRYTKRYPFGRLIQVANGVVLYDGPNIYPDFTMTRFILTPSPQRFWPGSSMVSSVLEMQKARNKLESGVVENQLRLNGGKMIADANCGLDPAKMANIPGEFLLKTPGTEIGVHYPPPMPPDMVNAGSRLGGIMREVLGFNPSRMGTGSRGNVAAELTETEISQSMGLSRLRGRLLYVSVQRLVSQIFSRMAQFYRYPRTIPCIDHGTWSPVTWEPLEDPKAYEGYSVHVDEASFQVRSKTMMQRLYLALGKMGKIPNLDLLRMLEIPNADEVAGRLTQDLMLQAIAKGHAGKGKNAGTQF